MKEMLTTDEAAAYLRVSERKLYEMVADAAVPCSKVTGRWLFPRAALDRWVAAGMALADAQPASPPIIGGTHDPLLDWALRESRCGLASLAEGSEAGLRRLARREVMIAGIHLHRSDGDDVMANIDAVAATPGLHDAVTIAFVRREQGLLMAPGNPLALDNIGSIADGKARVAQRPAGAGAQLLLLSLLARGGHTPSAVKFVKAVAPTGPDLAEMIRRGEADCGIASRAVAQAADLHFIPLCWEHLDLVMRQRDYFQPQPQILVAFMREPPFVTRAREMSGYDTAQTGQVRAVT